jgi:hypothetical protein
MTREDIGPYFDSSSLASYAAMVLDAIDSESPSGPGNQLIERGRQIAEKLGGQAPDELNALLMALLCRVEIQSDRVEPPQPKSQVKPSPPRIASERGSGNPRKFGRK